MKKLDKWNKQKYDGKICWIIMINETILLQEKKKHFKPNTKKFKLGL